jgi:hypothetical protein
MAVEILLIWERKYYQEFIAEYNIGVGMLDGVLQFITYTAI